MWRLLVLLPLLCLVETGCAYTQLDSGYERFPGNPDYLLVFLSEGHEIVSHDFTADTFELVVSSETVIVGHQFSPDGRRLAFFNVGAPGHVPTGSRSVELHVLSLDNPDADLFVFPIEGFVDSPLITNDFVLPVWESDSSLLVAHARGIIRIGLDGTSETLVEQKNIKSLALAPDGSQIAYGYDKHVVLMNPDGSGAVDVTEVTGIIDDLRGINTRAVAFSPDGTRMAVGSGPDLVMVDRSPLEAARIFDAKLEIAWIAWKPSGDRLFVVSGREFRRATTAFPVMVSGRYGRYRLTSIDPAGAHPVDLYWNARTDVLNAAPSMSPDGSYVALVYQVDTARRIVVVATDGSGVRMPATGSSERYPTWWP